MCMPVCAYFCIFFYSFPNHPEGSVAALVHARVYFVVPCDKFVTDNSVAWLGLNYIIHDEA